MGHLPVITDVWRITIDWNTNGGVTPHNVMHFLDGVGGRPADEVAANIWQNWTADMFDCIGSGYTTQTLSCLKLDGTSATSVQTIPTINQVGGGGGLDAEPNAAAVIKLATGLRGRSNRGRVYLGPIAESAVATATVNSGVRDTMTAAWVAFANAMVTLEQPLGVASYRHANWHQVTDLICRQRVGSVRRRLDQLPL